MERNGKSNDEVLALALQRINQKQSMHQGIQSLQKEITQHEVRRVWGGVGQLVGDRLRSGSGVRIDGFGTFTLDRDGQPAFLLAQEFINKNRVTQGNTPTPGSLVASKLNLARLASNTEVTRPCAETILSSVLRTLPALISKKFSFELTIPPVARMHCSIHKKVEMRFFPEFCRDMNRIRRETLSTPGGYSRVDGDKPLVRRMAESYLSKKTRPAAGKPLKRHPDDNYVTYWEEGKQKKKEKKRDFVKEQIQKYAPKVKKQTSVHEDRSSTSRSSSRSRVRPRPGSAPSPRLNLSKLPLVERVRKKIKERGGNGLKALTRAFMIMDDDEDDQLTKNELTNGLKDFGVKFRPQELQQLYAYLDKDGNGFVDLEELLETLAPKLNQKRLDLVDMVFHLLDRDKSGTLTLADIEDLYKVDKSPEVMDGKKTKRQMMAEFLSQWDCHDEDELITLAEFRDYYQRVGMNIDNDEHFELMIRNAWRIPGGKGAAANTANRRGVVKKNGEEEIDIVDYGMLKSQPTPPFRPSTPPYWVEPEENRRIITRPADYDKLPLIHKIHLKMKERGAHGLKSLTRAFRIMDDNGDDKLSKYELENGLLDWGLEFTQEELQEIMCLFDKDGDGHVDLEELLEAIAPKLNDRRKALVDMVFERLDIDGSGHLEVSDLKELYRFDKDEAVKNGHKTPAQAAALFLDQWDTNDDGLVTLDEFREYYQRIGLNIDNDKYFELMIRNAWRIPGGVGQAANTANKRGLVRRNGQEVVEIVDHGRLRTPTRRRGEVAAALNGPPSAYSNSPLQAWSESEVSSRDPRQVVAAQVDAKNDHMARLKKILFTPPKTYEDFVRKSLNASTMQENLKVSTTHIARRLQQADRTLSWVQAEEISKATDPYNSKYVDVQWLYNQLCNRFGKVPVDARPQNVVEMVQKQILEAGGDVGIKKLARILGVHPDDKEARLTKMALREGLQKFGILISVRGIDDLMTVYDADKNEFITWEELIDGVRPKLSNRRRKIVNEVFDQLDMYNRGKLQAKELVARYDYRYHPGVMDGTLERSEAMRGFQQRWRGQPDGMVTSQDFSDYYRDISVHVNGDDFFEQMVRNAWRVNSSGSSTRSASLDASQFSTPRTQRSSQRPWSSSSSRFSPPSRGSNASTGLESWTGSDRRRARRAGQLQMAGNSMRGLLTGEDEPKPIVDNDTRIFCAVTIQRVFRGHLARLYAWKIRRRRLKQERETAASLAEKARPRSKFATVKRAHLKTTYGF